jgi:hypothetical protein
MFVQDTSGSMAPYIQTFRVLATSLVNAVLKLSRTAQTGLASFIEKPVFPQVCQRNVDRSDGVQQKHRASLRAIQSINSPTARFVTLLTVSRHRLASRHSFSNEHCTISTRRRIAICPSRRSTRSVKC